jgi:outer membrane protein assembly factor BamE
MGTRIRYDTFFSNRPNPSGLLAMRHFLISALLLTLLAGCSGFRFGPHRIDVQQGNALDQENVARLKLGLNHSQVRFLLGTPLLVDPFHNDRWDYVYVYYTAGKLSEQRRISLFFEGDSLVRIEGDMPSAEAAAQAPTPAAPAVTEANQKPAPQPEPIAAPSEPAVVPAAAAVKAPPAAAAAATPAKAPTAAPAKTPTPAAVKSASAASVKAQTAAPTAPAGAPPVVSAAVAPDAAPAASAKTPPASPNRTVSAATSIVAPLPSPKGAPPYKDPHPAAELSLQSETDVEQIKPDVIPPFPATAAAATVNEDAVLKAVNAWVSAWARRDDAAYFAAYDPDFIPQGGGSHADWVKRRRMLLEVAKNIDVKIESPSVERAEDGSVTVTFNQFYRSDNYRDAVVKQLRMTERDGRWLIVDEKVLSVLHKAKP